MVRRVAVAWALALAVAASASAQTGSSGTSTGQNHSGTQTQSSSTATADDTRPATTTFFGDTGLWFVPTAEVLPHGKWSVSGYRRGTNYIQGYTNVGDFAGTFAVGIKDRAEIFGSFLVDTRIDRDLRPLFVNDPTFGGIIDRYPQGESAVDRRQPRRLLPRRQGQSLVRVPAEPGGDRRCAAWSSCPPAKNDVGNGTGKADGESTSSSARKFAKTVEWSGYGGYEVPRQARTASTRRAARSAGAPASGSRRATSCASPRS